MEAITTAIHYHLGRLLGINGLSNDFATMLGFIGEIDQLGPQIAWSRNSFVEEYTQKMDLDLTSAFGTLLRENPTPAFNPTILGPSPIQVTLPPIGVPLLPITMREGEITIASSVPGLNRLLEMGEFHLLNRFWGVPRINTVWCEPAQLRDVIRSLGVQCSVEVATIEAPVGIKNGRLPWIDLDSIPPERQDQSVVQPCASTEVQRCPCLLRQTDPDIGGFKAVGSASKSRG